MFLTCDDAPLNKHKLNVQCFMYHRVFHNIH